MRARARPSRVRARRCSQSGAFAASSSCVQARDCAPRPRQGAGIPRPPRRSRCLALGLGRSARLGGPAHGKPLDALRRRTTSRCGRWAGAVRQGPGASAGLAGRRGVPAGSASAGGARGRLVLFWAPSGQAPRSPGPPWVLRGRRAPLPRRPLRVGRLWVWVFRRVRSPFL